jgi:hypothetical protein
MASPASNANVEERRSSPLIVVRKVVAVVQSFTNRSGSPGEVRRPSGRDCGMPVSSNPSDRPITTAEPPAPERMTIP